VGGELLKRRDHLGAQRDAAAQALGFRYAFSRPFAKARRTVNTPPSRSTSVQSAPKASSGRTPVPTRKIASGPNGPSVELVGREVLQAVTIV
jgi:hypothetical protein